MSTRRGKKDGSRGGKKSGRTRRKGADDDREDFIIQLLQRINPASAQLRLDLSTLLDVLEGDDDEMRAMVAANGCLGIIIMLLDDSSLDLPTLVDSLQVLCRLTHLDALDAEFQEIGLELAATVLGFLNNRPAEAVVQQWGLIVLARVAMKNDDIVDAILEQNGLETVARAFRAHPNSQGVCHYGLVATRSLLIIPGPRLSALVAQSGIVSAAVAAMRAFPGNEDLQDEGCIGICNLAMLDELRAHIMEAGCAGAVVAALKAHPKSAYVQLNGCWALGSMTNIADDIPRIVEAGGLEVVWAAVNAHTKDPRVQDQAIYALHNMCNNEAVQVRLRELGGLDQIAKVMYLHRAVQRIQSMGCIALGNLADAPLNQQQMGGLHEAVRVVVDVLERHRGHSSIQMNGTWMLTVAALRCEPEGFLVSCGAVETAIGAMERFRDDHKIQENGCRILARIAWHESNRAYIWEHGGFEAALAAMAAHPTVALVQTDACFAIAHIAAIFDNKDYIRENGVMEAVVKAMREHPKAENVQEWGALALHNCGVHTVPNKQIMYALGAVDIAINALNEFPAAATLQRNALRLIDGLGELDMYILSQPALDTIHAAIERHPDNAMIAESGVSCFANLARGHQQGEVSDDAFVKALQATVHVMGVQRDDKTQRAGCRVISVLARERSDQVVEMLHPCMDAVRQALTASPAHASVQSFGWAAVRCIISQNIADAREQNALLSLALADTVAALSPLRTPDTLSKVLLTVTSIIELDVLQGADLHQSGVLRAVLDVMRAYDGLNELGLVVLQSLIVQLPSNPRSVDVASGVLGALYLAERENEEMIVSGGVVVTLLFDDGRGD